MNRNDVLNLNPYKGLDQTDPAETQRLNAFISREDYNIIQNVCPIHGTSQVVVTLIVKAIANALKKKGITTYDPDALFTLLERCATALLTDEADDGDVGRGTSRARAADSRGKKGTAGTKQSARKRANNNKNQTKQTESEGPSSATY